MPDDEEGLRRSIARAMEYGEARPDDYGGLSIVEGRVLVLVRGNIDRHQGALTALEDGSAELRAIPFDGPTYGEKDAALDAVRRRLEGDPARPLRGTSGGGRITLKARFEDLAAELAVQYGELLEITLGNKPFPPERTTVPEPLPVDVGTTQIPELRTWLTLSCGAVPAGDDFRGTLTVTNTAQRELVFATGILVGGLRSPGSKYLASRFDGELGFVAHQIHLRSGDSEQLPIVIGVASCLPDRSYTVPPGPYEPVVVLDLTFSYAQAPERLVRIGQEFEVGWAGTGIEYTSRCV